jgi:RNA polymerase sigma factor (sigma-70 family)
VADGAGAGDAELVAAARDGDKDAFAELVTRHWATAVALASRLLGSPEEARDAAQEAAVAALVGLDRLRAPGRFGAWFCGITLNVARGFLRRSRVEQVAVREPDQASPDPGPDERAELADLAVRVRAAVAQLADGQRDAVLLFYLQGLTHREVAAELAISVGAVKARLHQARAALTPALVPLVGADDRTAKEPVMPTTASSPAWTEVSVADIRHAGEGHVMSHDHVVVLTERDGPRLLPMWVGPAEATGLALTLQAVDMPRPLTYQMAAGLLAASGSRVSEVRITRLTGEVFYAAIVVDGPTGSHEVDARPSDAVNLALVTGARILADGALLDDPRVTSHPEWQEFPSGTAALAQEAQQRAARYTASPEVGPGVEGQVEQ